MADRGGENDEPGTPRTGFADQAEEFAIFDEPVCVYMLAALFAPTRDPRKGGRGGRFPALGTPPIRLA